jgi:hypothetical protein
MKKRITIKGERVFTTRSTTTVESTIFYQKKRHLYHYLAKIMAGMGIQKVEDLQ